MRIVKDKSSLPWNFGFAAWVPETGTTLKGHTWHYLKQVLGAHLDKHNLHVGDREAYLHEAVCQAMERDGRGGRCLNAWKGTVAQTRTKAYETDPRIPKGLRRGKSGYDAYAWACWQLSAQDGKLDAKYARELIARIGCGSCRSHAQRYLAAHPIPATGSASFEWVVDFHNSVNAKIGKPIVTPDQARQIWSI